MQVNGILEDHNWIKPFTSHDSFR